MKEQPDAAQQLFWEVESLRAEGAAWKVVSPKLKKMAQLYEERALQLLLAETPCGRCAAAAAHGHGQVPIFV